MKQVLFSFAILFSLNFTSSEQRTVYLCVSPNAYAYHLKKTCHGLKRCTHGVKAVSLSAAKGKYKRRLCGYED